MPTLAANCITVPVPTWRRWLVLGLAALLIAGHAYDTLVQREHWPFSYYPMYSRVQPKPRLAVLGLYGLIRDGEHTRLEQMNAADYLPPLQEVHLRNILMTAWGRDGTAAKAQQNTATILHDYLRVYESRRVAGLHRGPPLLGAQLCLATYLLRAGVANAKPSRVQSLLGVGINGATHLYSIPATQPSSELKDEADARS